MFVALEIIEQNGGNRGLIKLEVVFMALSTALAVVHEN